MTAAIALAAGLLAVGAPSAKALVAPIAAMQPGLTVAEATKRLEAAGAKAVRQLGAATPQAMADALLSSGLLGMLQVFDAVPVDKASKELDKKAFRTFLVADFAGATIVAVFGPKLRVAMQRILVPVDASADQRNAKGAARDRLAARLAVLGALKAAGYALTPIKRDRHGNVFRWKARSMRALYVPAVDELRVLRL